MRKGTWAALAALLSVLLLTVTLTGQTPRPPAATAKQPLEVSVAQQTKLKEADVLKVLKAVGPAVSEKLRAGEAVTLPGLGTLRIVRVEEHKDLVSRLPARVPPVNYVEFIPTGELSNIANAPGATPNLVVPPNEFNVNPNTTPGLKTGSTRAPSTRTR
jgi:nucleoid DNA-binding protein